MTFRYKLEKFIFKNKEFVGSHGDLKSIMLCGQMALAAILVGVTYIVIDLLNHVTPFLIYYVALMVVAGVVIILLRNTYYHQAKVLLLASANFLIYFFASNDTLAAGVYLYFIVSSIMGLALFGFNKLKIALVFSALSLLLFFLSYMGTFKILTLSSEDISIMNDPGYIQISFLSNFIIGFFICIVLLYFLLDVNNHSEKLIMSKNDELAKTNKELDRFVYSASHDLRAPLSSLLGLIEVSRLAKSKEELDECMKMMKGRVHNLERFIGDIIDFSRNSRQEIQKAPVNLYRACHEVVDGLKFAHGQENTAIKFHIPAELEFMCDLPRLKIILSNIIGNAMKYHDPNKTLHQIDISGSLHGDTVHIEIKDNGIGISSEHHQRVFEMFYRASEKSHGSGLGLYIVQETITKLEGNIRFDSTLGKGTSFIISLPA